MDLLSKPTNKGGLGTKNNRPRNIRETTQKAKLSQYPGKEVSTFFKGSAYSHAGPFF